MSSRAASIASSSRRFEKLLPAIAAEKAISDELTAELEKAVSAYKDQSGFGKTDDTAATRAKAEAAEDVAEQELEEGVATMRTGA